VTAQPDTSAPDSEVDALRARIAELETELADQARTTNTLVAQAQEKLYWLERWHVDLDKVMARPGALQALEIMRWLRGMSRSVRRLKRRLLGG
jgi:uncharacterized coiled-coil protein SlyX